MLDLRDVYHTVIRDPGSARVPEDGIGVEFNVACVVDAYSALYHPTEGPTLYKGRSSGQVVREIILETLRRRAHISLNEALRAGNAKVHRTFVREHSIPDCASALPGAAFVGIEVAESSPQQIKVLQGSDALAIWRTPQGIDSTPDQAYLHEEYLNNEFSRALAQNASAANPTLAAWTDRFADIQSHRNKWSNRPGGYATLNGDPAVAKLWRSFTIPLQKPVTVILFSDGFIRFQGNTDRMDLLAPLLFQRYDKGGLEHILASTRTLEQERAGTSHEEHAEATAIAFEFR